MTVPPPVVPHRRSQVERREAEGGAVLRDAPGADGPRGDVEQPALFRLQRQVHVLGAGVHVLPVHLPLEEESRQQRQEAPEELASLGLPLLVGSFQDPLDLRILQERMYVGHAISSAQTSVDLEPARPDGTGDFEREARDLFV